MANKKENDLTWCYTYSNGCGPCARVTPIIDAFIATGMKIEKIDIQTAPATLRRSTPSIFRKNSKNEIVGNIFSAPLLTSYGDLRKLYPFMFKEGMADPIKLIAEILSSTEEGEFEKQIKS
jgi:hypothetical protein